MAHGRAPPAPRLPLGPCHTPHVRSLAVEPPENAFEVAGVKQTGDHLGHLKRGGGRFRHNGSMDFDDSRPTTSRLLLVDRVGWFHLERPVFIDAGCRFWTEPRALVVETPEGEQRRYTGWVCR